MSPRVRIRGVATRGRHSEARPDHPAAPLLLGKWSAGRVRWLGRRFAQPLRGPNTTRAGRGQTAREVAGNTFHVSREERMRYRTSPMHWLLRSAAALMLGATPAGVVRGGEDPFAAPPTAPATTRPALR